MIAKAHDWRAEIVVAPTPVVAETIMGAGLHAPFLARLGLGLSARLALGPGRARRRGRHNRLIVHFRSFAVLAAWAALAAFTRLAWFASTAFAALATPTAFATAASAAAIIGFLDFAFRQLVEGGAEPVDFLADQFLNVFGIARVGARHDCIGNA